MYGLPSGGYMYTLSQKKTGPPMISLT